MRSWALLVEYGHACPRSTSGVNVRIEGLRVPPVGLTLHLAGSRAACAQYARGSVRQVSVVRARRGRGGVLADGLNFVTLHML